MKKLMIAAAIVCAAAMSQAAKVQWSASGVYQMGSDELKAGDTYSAYFVSIADMYAADTTTQLAKGYSLADAKTALGKGDASFLKDYGLTPTAFGVYTTGTTAGQGKGSASAVVTADGAANSQTWTGYLVILDSTSIDGATYAFISDTVTKTTGDTGGMASLSFSSTMLAGTKDGTKWYAVAVPEPTSGLLLLLGVGVMALRRRRA